MKSTHSSLYCNYQEKSNATFVKSFVFFLYCNYQETFNIVSFSILQPSRDIWSDEFCPLDSQALGGLASV